MEAESYGDRDEEEEDIYPERSTPLEAETPEGTGGFDLPSSEEQEFWTPTTEEEEGVGGSGVALSSGSSMNDSSFEVSRKLRTGHREDDYEEEDNFDNYNNDDYDEFGDDKNNEYDDY
jgi:hypothetical protein